MSLVATLLVPAVALAIPPGLKKSEPVACDGSKALVLSKRYIETKGDGVVVEGQCKVTITDSHIVARGYAVSAFGEGEVTVRNSVLKGGKSAINVGDQAVVKSQGNKLTGGILVMGRADYDDQGGNQNERSPEAPAAVVAEGGDGEGGESAEGAAGESAESAEPSPKTVLPKNLRKSKPVVCRKNVKAITLKKRVITAKRDGVVIYGGCVVTVEQSLIKAGGWAISHQGKGKLVIKDSIIEGRKGALQVHFETAKVALTGSTLKGKLEKKDGVELDDQGGNTFED